VSLLAVILALLVLALVVFVVGAPIRAARDRAAGSRAEGDTADAAAQDAGWAPDAAREPWADAELDELETAREAKYQEIRDAELDYRTGKLSREDYRAIDADLRAEGLEILDRIERLQAQQTGARQSEPGTDASRAGADPAARRREQADGHG
jgi:hypothetical protein